MQIWDNYKGDSIKLKIFIIILFFTRTDRNNLLKLK